MGQVDVFKIGIGIPNVLCAVRPPFKSVAAIPDEAVSTYAWPTKWILGARYTSLPMIVKQLKFWIYRSEI